MKYAPKSLLDALRARAHRLMAEEYLSEAIRVDELVCRYAEQPGAAFWMASLREYVREGLARALQMERAAVILERWSHMNPFAPTVEREAYESARWRAEVAITTLDMQKRVLLGDAIGGRPAPMKDQIGGAVLGSWRCSDCGEAVSGAAAYAYGARTGVYRCDGGCRNDRLTAIEVRARREAVKRGHCRARWVESEGYEQDESNGRVEGGERPNLACQVHSGFCIYCGVEVQP